MADVVAMQPIESAPTEQPADGALVPISDAPDGAIDPARVRLLRGPRGELRVEIEQDRCLLLSKAVRVFPLSQRQQYVSILDPKNKEVCLLEDVDRLDPASRALLDEALADYYRLNRVLRVYSFRSEYRTSYWEVETERGRRDFVVKTGSDTWMRPSEHELLLVDVDGNRFHIPDLRALDPQSNKALRLLV